MRGTGVKPAVVLCLPGPQPLPQIVIHRLARGFIAGCKHAKRGMIAISAYDAFALFLHKSIHGVTVARRCALMGPNGAFQCTAQKRLTAVDIKIILFGGNLSHSENKGFTAVKIRSGQIDIDW
jgi:hypothetical protein